MEQSEDPVHKPSVFMYSVWGFFVANAMGIPVVAVLSLQAGDYNAQAAFQIFVCTGAMGAMVGFEIAARRLKAFGGGGMKEEWKRFWESSSSYGLGAVILGGSFVITVLGSLIASAVMDPANPK